MNIPQLNTLTVLSGDIQSNIAEIECDFEEFHPDGSTLLAYDYNYYIVNHLLMGVKKEPINERLLHSDATSTDFHENVKLYFESLQGSFVIDYDKKKVLYKRNKEVAFLGESNSFYHTVEKLLCIIDCLLDKPEFDLFVPFIDMGLTEEAQALLTQLICKAANVYKEAGYKIIISTHSNIVINNILISTMRGYMKREDVSIQFLDENNEWHKHEITENDRIKNPYKSFFTQNTNDLSEILGF